MPTTGVSFHFTDDLQRLVDEARTLLNQINGYADKTEKEVSEIGSKMNTAGIDKLLDKLRLVNSQLAITGGKISGLIAAGIDPAAIAPVAGSHLSASRRAANLGTHTMNMRNLPITPGRDRTPVRSTIGPFDREIINTRNRMSAMLGQIGASTDKQFRQAMFSNVRQQQKLLGLYRSANSLDPKNTKAINDINKSAIFLKGQINNELKQSLAGIRKDNRDREQIRRDTLNKIKEDNMRRRDTLKSSLPFIQAGLTRLGGMFPNSFVGSALRQSVTMGFMGAGAGGGAGAFMRHRGEDWAIKSSNYAAAGNERMAERYGMYARGAHRLSTAASLGGSFLGVGAGITMSLAQSAAGLVKDVLVGFAVKIKDIFSSVVSSLYTWSKRIGLGGAAGIAAVTYAGVREFSERDLATRGLKVVGGKDAGALSNYVSELKTSSKGFFSTNEITNALRFATQFGFSVDELKRVMPALMNATALRPDLDLGQGGRALARAATQSEPEAAEQYGFNLYEKYLKQMKSTQGMDLNDPIQKKEAVIMAIEEQSKKFGNALAEITLSFKGATKHLASVKSDLLVITGENFLKGSQLAEKINKLSDYLAGAGTQKKVAAFFLGLGQGVNKGMDLIGKYAVKAYNAVREAISPESEGTTASKVGDALFAAGTHIENVFNGAVESAAKIKDSLLSIKLPSILTDMFKDKRSFQNMILVTFDLVKSGLTDLYGFVLKNMTRFIEAGIIATATVSRDMLAYGADRFIGEDAGNAIRGIDPKLIAAGTILAPMISALGSLGPLLALIPVAALKIGGVAAALSYLFPAQAAGASEMPQNIGPNGGPNIIPPEYAPLPTVGEQISSAFSNAISTTATAATAPTPPVSTLSSVNSYQDELNKKMGFVNTGGYEWKDLGPSDERSKMNQIMRGKEKSYLNEIANLNNGMSPLMGDQRRQDRINEIKNKLLPGVRGELERGNDKVKVPIYSAIKQDYSSMLSASGETFGALVDKNIAAGVPKAMYKGEMKPGSWQWWQKADDSARPFQAFVGPDKNYGMADSMSNEWFKQGAPKALSIYEALGPEMFSQIAKEQGYSDPSGLTYAILNGTNKPINLTDQQKEAVAKRTEELNAASAAASATGAVSNTGVGETAIESAAGKFWDAVSAFLGGVQQLDANGRAQTAVVENMRKAFDELLKKNATSTNQNSSPAPINPPAPTGQTA